MQAENKNENMRVFHEINMIKKSFKCAVCQTAVVFKSSIHYHSLLQAVHNEKHESVIFHKPKWQRKKNEPKLCNYNTNCFTINTNAPG